MGNSYGDREMKENRVLRKRYYSVLLCIWITFMIVGCRARSYLPLDLLGVEVEESEINNRMHLYTPEGINTFKTSESVKIAIEGTSKDYISYFYSEVKLFLLNEEQWIEVDNLIEGHPDQQLLSPYKKSSTNPQLIIISPNLPNPSQPVTLRVVIIGHIMHGGEVTDELTADYIDIKLEP